MSLVDSIGPRSSRLIPLYGKYGAGLFLIVDEDVYKWARHFCWFLSPNGYGSTRSAFTVKLIHRIIMDDPKTETGRGQDIDHVNGNKLDNRRANLRIVTRAQNNRNSPPRRNAASQYKGVTFHRKAKRWASRITLDDKSQVHLGLFDTQEEAARAYDAVARQHFGNCCWLNFPDPGHVQAKRKKRSHYKTSTVRPAICSQPERDASGERSGL